MVLVKRSTSSSLAVSSISCCYQRATLTIRMVDKQKEQRSECHSRISLYIALLFIFPGLVGGRVCHYSEVKASLYCTAEMDGDTILYFLFPVLVSDFNVSLP